MSCLGNWYLYFVFRTERSGIGTLALHQFFLDILSFFYFLEATHRRIGHGQFLSRFFKIITQNNHLTLCDQLDSSLTKPRHKNWFLNQMYNGVITKFFQEIFSEDSQKKFFPDGLLFCICFL